jgi:hypothetical protein
MFSITGEWKIHHELFSIFASLPLKSLLLPDEKVSPAPVIGSFRIIHGSSLACTGISRITICRVRSLTDH